MSEQRDTLSRQSRSRWTKVREDWGTHYFLWSHRNKGIELEGGEVISGPSGYPPPWRHLRSYLCTLTGGCSWGPLYEGGSALLGPERFCWKCRSTWANPRDTQNDRPWRRTRGPFLLISRFEQWRSERHLDRIKRRAHNA